MNNSNSLSFIGYASGIAAGDPGCGQGPVVLWQSDLIATLKQTHLVAAWQDLLYPDEGEVLPAVVKLCQKLADKTRHCVEQKQAFVVFGGDHSCAIGTWSGVVKAQNGPIGLIWIDAHMDSHTPETSESGNIHGMPLACLLGYGPQPLTQIMQDAAKLQPDHVCLIGIRSYEPGEAELIKRLGIRVYDMEEVHQRGIDEIVKEAVMRVKQGTTGYGITIDLDGIDPQDAPGVGTPEPNGIRGDDLCRALMTTIRGDSDLLGAEITEFNPNHDRNAQTQKMIQKLLLSLF